VEGEARVKYVPQQCKVCPFRKTSAQGWLGGYTPATVFSSIWHGVPFFCHDSIDYTKPNCIREAVRDPKKGKLCVGGLVFANKIFATQTTEYPLILEAREKVKLRTDIECMEPREFYEHHPDWQGEEKLAKGEPPYQKNDEDPGPGLCIGCKKPVDEGCYCFGCKKHICNDCDKSIDLPWGPHKPESHLHE
jgi:hypothetical protein